MTKNEYENKIKELRDEINLECDLANREENFEDAKKHLDKAIHLAKEMDKLDSEYKEILLTEYKTLKTYAEALGSL